MMAVSKKLTYKRLSRWDENAIGEHVYHDVSDRSALAPISLEIIKTLIAVILKNIS